MHSDLGVCICSCVMRAFVPIVDDKIIRVLVSLDVLIETNLIRLFDF